MFILKTELDRIAGKISALQRETDEVKIQIQKINREAVELSNQPNPDLDRIQLLKIQLKEADRTLVNIAARREALKTDTQQILDLLSRN